MADTFRIDHHKLIFHPERVARWLSGQLIYPLYMEISPSGGCNHRCTFCAFDYLGYQNRFLDTALFKERLSELGRLGVKSIMYGGEGEPLLHPEIHLLTAHGHASGLDVAVTSNGVLFDETKAQSMLPHIKWIKFSINAGNRENYARIHRTKASDFDRVIENLTTAVKVKQKGNLKCTIGMQMLLLPENRMDVFNFVKRARDLGADYAVVKPYSQHFESKGKMAKDLVYKGDLNIRDSLCKYNSGTFQVIFRDQAMKKWDEGKREYAQCLGLPFWSYVDSGGNVWACSSYLGHDRFCFGNIMEETFQKVWEGEKRKRFLQWMHDGLDVKKCRLNCRMDEINRYLWELTHPGEHVNFI